MTDTLTVADLEALGIDPLACGRRNGEAARIWPADLGTLADEPSPLEGRQTRFTREVTAAFHAWEETRFGRVKSPCEIHYRFCYYVDKSLTDGEIDRLSNL